MMAAPDRIGHELQRLRDRVEELEGLLAGPPDEVVRIAAVFSLPRQPALMLGLLLRRAVASREALYTVIYGARSECDQPTERVIDVQLVKVRAALAAHGVELKRTPCRFGAWSITSADRERLKALIRVYGTRASAPVDLSERRRAFLAGP